MNCSNAVDTQKIVDLIDDLSASGRIHKRPLAQVLKGVQVAVFRLAEFRPEQAKQIATGMEKAVAVLSAQKSNMEEKKANGLRKLAGRLDACFSYSMEKAGESMEAYRQEQADIPNMMVREKNRIERKHQARIDTLRNYLYGIRQCSHEHDRLSRKLCKLDVLFETLLEKGGFTQSERQIAIEHYKTPITTQVKGRDRHSSDEVFSDEEALRRFGGAITKHQNNYGRRQYVMITNKVYTPANTRGKIWTQFRELAEQRRFARNKLYRHPARAESSGPRVKLNIKAEKAVRTAEIETLQTIASERSVQLRAGIDQVGAQIDTLRQARDVLAQYQADSRCIPSKSWVRQS